MGTQARRDQIQAKGCESAPVGNSQAFERVGRCKAILGAGAGMTKNRFKVGAASVEIGGAEHQAFKRMINAALPTASRIIIRVTRQIKTSAQRGGFGASRRVSGMSRQPQAGRWPIGRPRRPGPDRDHWRANSKRLIYTEHRFDPPHEFVGVVGCSAPYAWAIKRRFPYSHQRVGHQLLVKPYRKHAPIIAEAIAKDMAKVS